MDDLQKFNSPLSNAEALASFKFDKPSVILNNEPSTRNFSAYIATLGSSGNIVDNYRGVKSEMEEGGTSSTADQIVNLVQERKFTTSRDAVVDYLSDPNMDISSKEELANKYLNARLQVNTVPKSLSEEALVASNKGETKESETVRINTAEIIDKVNEDKKQLQSLMNANLVSKDANLSNKVKSFAELLVPFTESGQLAVISNQWKKESEAKVTPVKSLALMGEARNDIRQALLKMEPSQRMNAMTQLVDIINSHSGIVLTDDNDFTRAANIRAFLEDGAYSTWDRLVDDATSLLDMSIIGSPVAKLVSKGSRFFRGAKEAQTATREAQVAGKVDEAVVASKEAEIASTPKDVFDPIARANSDFNEGLSMKQATHFAGVIQNTVGWRESRQYYEAFKKAFQTPDNVKGFGEDVPDFFKIDVQSKADKMSVRSEVQPTSVSQNLKDTNPEKAVNAHEVSARDQSDEAAKALYGTNRTEAIANDLLPEIGSGGVVRGKVGSIDRVSVSEATPNAEIMDFVNNPGMYYYFKEEKVAQRARVVNDFKNAVGLHSRNEMFNIEDIPDGVVIRGVYGPKEGGFSSVNDALSTAEYSLKDYGVKFEDMSILRREGDDYIPVDFTKTALNGDFLIQVNHKYQFNPADIIEWSKPDVKNNFFDYIRPISEGNRGSFQQHILDAHSMLHPNITFGANVAVDSQAGLEKALTNISSEFSKSFTSLSKERRNEMIAFIKEANESGIDFSSSVLKARGFNEKEISTLNKWRESWDTIYWLENKDLVKTLRNRGWGMYIDRSADTSLVAKPVGRNSVSGGIHVYDPVSDSARLVKHEELTDLYNRGGTVAELKTPIEVDGKAYNYVISHETPNKGFIKALTDEDQVLTYRKGYYQVHYFDPYFVEKIVKDDAGNIISRRAVATASSQKDARVISERLSAVTNDNVEYNIRGDIKNFKSNNDSYWDLQVAQGRTAQRVRGKRLEDATSHITTPGHENILDPMEALTKSIRSVSRRVSMRDYLDTTKERFIQQYAELLPKNQYGQTIMPERKSDIGGPGVLASHKLADARTTYDFIRSMEGGYVNSIDDFYKASLNTLAEIVGKYEGKVPNSVERLARAASEGSPTNISKGIAFKAYLALNPLRQMLIQSHQMVRLTALFPSFVGSGKMTHTMGILTYGLRDLPVSDKTLKSLGLTQSDFSKMVQDFRRSGLMESVDVNNLVRGDIVSLADMSVISQVKDTVSYPAKLAQKIGFDSGERANIMSAWLCFRDKAIKDGRVLNSETMEEVAAQARNMTYNMNRAGDMPYNRNELNVFFQFLQVPHKALTQDFFNRGLSAYDRSKLLAFDLAMWGVGPVAAIPGINSILNAIEDSDTRRLVSNGLEEMVINKVLSMTTGKDTHLDFSDFAPGNYVNFLDTVGALWTTDLGSLIASTPSGQLFFGGNPRITNAFKTGARYFNLIDDYEDPTQFGDVAKSFAGISSGFSNAFQATYILKYGEKLSSSGQVVADNLTTTEAIAQLFGIKTIKEAQQYKVSEDMYNSSKNLEEDFNKWWKGFTTTLRNDDLTPKQTEWVLRSYSEAFRVWGNDNPKIRSLITQNIQKSLSNKDDVIFMSFVKNFGSIPRSQWKQLVLDSGLPDSQKQSLLNVYDATEVK